VGRAIAGRAFTVSWTVKNARTGKGVKGRLSCTGKLSGTSLPAARRSTASGGKAMCTWNLPKSARGKRFAGSIAVSYQNVRVSRSFTVRVG